MNHPNDKLASIVQTNPFIQAIAQIYNGGLVTDAADELRHEIESVKKSGKPGSVTLVLSIKPDGKGEVIMVDVKGEVKRKKPKKEQRPTTFFIEQDFTLTRDDPGQSELFTTSSAPAATPAPVGVAKAAGN